MVIQEVNGPSDFHRVMSYSDMRGGQCVAAARGVHNKACSSKNWVEKRAIHAAMHRSVAQVGAVKGPEKRPW